MNSCLFAVLIFFAGYSYAGIQDNTLKCLDELKKDRRFSSIALHVALDGQDVTNPQMLIDRTSPDEQQKKAIADWIDARSQCVNSNPIKVFIDQHLLFLSIAPELYNGQMTFGDFNQKWRILFRKNAEAPVETNQKPFVHHH